MSNLNTEQNEQDESIDDAINSYKQTVQTKTENEHNNFFNFFKQHGTIGSINYTDVWSFYDKKLQTQRIFYGGIEYFDYSVFIGRFQIFTSAHKNIADDMLKRSRKVIFLLGSDFTDDIQRAEIDIRNPGYFMNRSKENPFSTEERIDYIKKIFISNYDQIIFTSLVDINNMPRWKTLVDQKIKNIIELDTIKSQKSLGTTVAIFGYNKDSTSYYLKWFSNYVNMISSTAKGNFITDQVLSASTLRTLWFLYDKLEIEYMPSEMAKWLTEWKISNNNKFNQIAKLELEYKKNKEKIAYENELLSNLEKLQLSNSVPELEQLKQTNPEIAKAFELQELKRKKESWIEILSQMKIDNNELFTEVILYLT